MSIQQANIELDVRIQEFEKIEKEVEEVDNEKDLTKS